MNGHNIYVSPIRKPSTTKDQYINESSQALHNISYYYPEEADELSASIICNHNRRLNAIQTRNAYDKDKIKLKISNIIDSVLYSEKGKNTKCIVMQRNGRNRDNGISYATTEFQKDMGKFQFNLITNPRNNKLLDSSATYSKEWDKANQNFHVENHPSIKADFYGNITFYDAFNMLHESQFIVKQNPIFCQNNKKKKSFSCTRKKRNLTSDLQDEKNKILKVRDIEFNELNEIHCRIANTVLYGLTGRERGLWISLGFKTNNLKIELVEEKMTSLLYMLYFIEVHPQKSADYYSREASVGFVYVCLECCKVVNYLLGAGKLDKMIKESNCTLLVVVRIYSSMVVYYYERYKKDNSQYKLYCLGHYQKISKLVAI